jgi:hypothetical protein
MSTVIAQHRDERERELKKEAERWKERSDRLALDLVTMAEHHAELSARFTKQQSEFARAVEDRVAEAVTRTKGASDARVRKLRQMTMEQIEHTRTVAKQKIAAAELAATMCRKCGSQMIDSPTTYPRLSIGSATLAGSMDATYMTQRNADFEHERQQWITKLNDALRRIAEVGAQTELQTAEMKLLVTKTAQLKTDVRTVNVELEIVRTERDALLRKQNSRIGSHAHTADLATLGDLPTWETPDLFQKHLSDVRGHSLSAAEISVIATRSPKVNPMSDTSNLSAVHSFSKLRDEAERRVHTVRSQAEDRTRLKVHELEKMIATIQSNADQMVAGAQRQADESVKHMLHALSEPSRTVASPAEARSSTIHTVELASESVSQGMIKAAVAEAVVAEAAADTAADTAAAAATAAVDASRLVQLTREAEERIDAALGPGLIAGRPSRYYAIEAVGRLSPTVDQDGGTAPGRVDASALIAAVEVVRDRSLADPTAQDVVHHIDSARSQAPDQDARQMVPTGTAYDHAEELQPTLGALGLDGYPPVAREPGRTPKALCPAGLAAGGPLLDVNTPAAEELEVVGPAGVGPGDVFDIDVGASDLSRGGAGDCDTALAELLSGGSSSSGSSVESEPSVDNFEKTNGGAADEDFRAGAGRIHVSQNSMQLTTHLQEEAMARQGRVRSLVQDNALEVQPPIDAGDVSSADVYAAARSQRRVPSSPARPGGELQQLKLTQLRTRALAAGVDHVLVDGAMDSEGPKASLIELVVQTARDTARRAEMIRGKAGGRAADERRRHVPTGQHLDATFSCDGPLEMGLHPDLTVQEIDPGGPADRAGAP